MASPLTDQRATEAPLAVMEDSEPGRILYAIVERGRALVSARALVVLILDGDELAVAATAGALDAEVDGLRFPSASSVRGLLEMDPGSRRPAADDPSALVTPLVFSGAPVGVIVALDKLGSWSTFSKHDHRLLEAFAAGAATAVATVRAVAQDRLQTTMEAAEHERGLWAKKLQDETLQGLAALRVTLAAALQQESLEALERAGEEAVSQIEVEIGKLRTLIVELRPAALDEVGLEAALMALAERSEHRTGLPIRSRFELNGGRLDQPSLETTVYRLVQEGLANVARHAHADSVELDVRRGEDEITVVVRDDGVGFEPGHVRGGFGLHVIRERVELARGQLQIESAPGSGTAVSATLPLGAD